MFGRRPTGSPVRGVGTLAEHEVEVLFGDLGADGDPLAMAKLGEGLPQKDAGPRA
jgi:hypothetical protein